ncbi:Coenzyme F420 hydrogenase/dehydrogenase, beta subunit C-terminal domain [Gaoshiqia sp. Z1-71]|uniref:Coenzyme F420 hydrogenase/dehydrogenase, beta subunit C-terminal domain n=1 Tax=Gaoshiqia hydrogeniformans TaxID=3290090 RepID=UPI003BF800C5
MIKDITKINNLCLGCGICHYAGLELKYKSSRGRFIPQFKGVNAAVLREAYQVCPSVGYDIVSRGTELYNVGSDIQYQLELGFFHKAFLVRSLRPKILKRASSGGIITELLLFLLREKLVDKVLVTKFVYTHNGPRTKTYLTDNYDEIVKSQGSKYCPVNMDEAIDEIKKSQNTIAIVAPPCYIAGFRNIQKSDVEFQRKIKYTIANFCGGYKDYRNIDALAKKYAIDSKDIIEFRFRGEGQPGNMLFKTSRKEVRIPYPLYVGQTGYSKILRCHLCVDATGELADFACGDAWLNHTPDSSNPWSIVICRTHQATGIIGQMKEMRVIQNEGISVKDIIESQKGNIKSKKYRQQSRIKLYKRLFYRIPYINEGYKKESSSVRTEMKVFILHKLRLMLQYVGFFNYFR